MQTISIKNYIQVLIYTFLATLVFSFAFPQFSNAQIRVVEDLITSEPCPTQLKMYHMGTYYYETMYCSNGQPGPIKGFDALVDVGCAASGLPPCNTQELEKVWFQQSFPSFIGRRRPPQGGLKPIPPQDASKSRIVEIFEPAPIDRVFPPQFAKTTNRMGVVEYWVLVGVDTVYLARPFTGKPESDCVIFDATLARDGWSIDLLGVKFQVIPRK